ncbi:MAG: hypothetical protein EAX96_21350 [Candidatus Lokiarchaeota archaeon]|nr:hypothetical protein [Candidatus Lokiarchaeota archaeon]
MSDKIYFFNNLAENKQKICIIIGLISLILFFINAYKIKWVLVDINDFLGLTSHLSIFYWIGFFLVLFCTLILYHYDRNVNQILYFFFLMVMGLYLLNIGVFVEENARFPWTYYPSGEAKIILSTNHVDISSPYPLTSYHFWPGIHFLTVMLISLNQLNFETLLKYMPLFWTFCFILLTYSIGKVVLKESKLSFIFTFLAILSFWSFHNYYGPQSVGILVYLLFLLLFLIVFERYTHEKFNKFFLLMMLIFFTLTIIHFLTVIAILIPFLFASLYLYFKKQKIIFLGLGIVFGLIFLVWNIYFTNFIFEYSINEIIYQTSNYELFSFFNTVKYSTTEILTRKIVHYLRLSYLIIYFLLISYAFMIYLFKNKNNRHEIGFLFVWVFGIIILLIGRYGANEIDDRVYILSLIPMLLIIMLTFSKKTLLFVILILAFMHIPSHYGTESYEMVRTTELIGSKFFAIETLNSEDSFSYHFRSFIYYYDPKKILVPWYSFTGAFKPDINLLNFADYIIESKQSNDFMIYCFGYNPVNKWLNLENPSLIYNNKYYNIYKK